MLLCLALVTSLSRAALTLVVPLPRNLLSVEGNGLAVVISCLLTWSGVRPGLAWSSSAACPATAAAACEVPEALANRAPIRACGLRSSA